MHNLFVSVMKPDKVDESSKFVETSKSSDDVKVLIEDNKYLVIWVVSGVAVIIFIVLVLSLIRCFCKDCIKKPLTPSSSDQTIPKTCEPMIIIDSIAVHPEVSYVLMICLFC